MSCVSNAGAVLAGLRKLFVCDTRLAPGTPGALRRLRAKHERLFPMTPFLLAAPAGAFGRPRVFASARAVPRAPRSAGTPCLCRAGATKSLQSAPSASAKLRAACSAVVLLPAAAAAAAPLDPASIETVKQVLCPLQCTLERRGAHLRRAAAPQVGAVLNVAAAPLALVFSAVLFLFMSLKRDLAKLEKE